MTFTLVAPGAYARIGFPGQDRLLAPMLARLMVTPDALLAPSYRGWSPTRRPP